MKNFPLIIFIHSVLCFLLPIFPTNAQQQNAEYPKNYFRNPMDIPITLAGSYGECRPNHFHTGIDIKTQQKENLPVRAAADGYISRINISHTGYGNTLYINHPNGYQTVYAHLNDFAPNIMKYLKTKQYEYKKWNVDIQIPDSILPVKKSDFIAYSGNTGGSVAPHLHFEIRSIKTEEVINAALFGFEIKDNIAPIPKSIAIYDASKSIYNQKAIIIPLISSGNHNYTSQQSIIKVPYKNIRIGVAAEDKMNGSYNLLGVPYWKMMLKNQLIFSISNERLSFEDNRFMNAYGDFKLFNETGKWYEAMYRLPFNKLKFYNENDGTIQLTEHNQIEILLNDWSQNTSKIKLQFQTENVKDIPLDCTYNSEKVNHISYGKLNFSFHKEYIYEPTCIEVQKVGSNALADIYTIGQPEIPLHSWSTIEISLNKSIPFHLRKKLVLLHKIKEAYLPGANPQTAVKAEFLEGKVKALVRTFGRYEVAIDTIAPKIKFHFTKDAQLNKAKSISFSLNEETTNLKKVKATIDGKWICFSRKGDVFTYHFDEMIQAGKQHTISIVADDENDNESQLSSTFYY